MWPKLDLISPCMNKPNMLTHELNYILLLNYKLERPRENHWQDNFRNINLSSRKVGCMSSTHNSLFENLATEESVLFKISSEMSISVGVIGLTPNRKLSLMTKSVDNLDQMY
jgi:hypothetical protein